MWCGRLSWLPVSFLLHVKYTLSYRIICPLAVFVSNAITVSPPYLSLFCPPKRSSWPYSLLTLISYLRRWHATLPLLSPIWFPSQRFLQNALQQIYYWMTANFLTFNFSKTEFLLIGVKQQLAKIHSSSLSTIHSARNLGFVFDGHLTFSDQICALSKSCITTFMNFAVSVRISISKQPIPLPPTLSILKLDYCNNSVYHNVHSKCSN